MLALAVRLHDYAIAPGVTNVPQEYSYAWTGVQLLTGHAPAGVSDLSSYAGRAQDYQFLGKTFHLVTPYVDHPPLYSLLSGGAELMAGVRNFGSMSPQVMRRPSLLLGVLTVVLAFFLARRLLPPIGALMATFLVAVEPGLVLLSRAAVPEALLTPMLLGAVLIATPGVPESIRQGSAGVGPASDQPPSKTALYGLCALCALAPLAELSGVVVGLAAASLLMARGLRREALTALGATAAGLVAFAGYGLAFDPHLFLSALFERAGGGGGVLTAVGFATSSIGAGRPMVDAWYLFAWAGLAYLAGNAKRRHRYRSVLWPAVIYVVVLIPYLAPQDLAISGWYRLPILPLVLVAAFAAIYSAVREGQLLVPALALLSAGLWSIQWLFGTSWRPGSGALLVIGAVALVPLAAAEVRARGRARDAALGVWGVIGLAVLAGNVVLSWNLAPYAGNLG